MELFWYPFCSSIICFRPKIVSLSNRHVQVVKSQAYLHYFQNTHSKMKINNRLWMYILKMEQFGIHFVQFSQVLSVSGQKTLTISNWYVLVVKSQLDQGSFQNTRSKIKTKHQIVNVHSKWNCLIPILFSLVKY